MTATIPSFTPSVITAGLNTQWKLKFDDYLYSDSWIYTIYLLGNGTQITITATDNGDSYQLFTKLASETSSYIAGDYSYTVVAVNGTSKVPMESGNITIKANFITATGGLDTRSENKIVLVNLKKAFKELSTKTTSQVTVDGVSYTRLSLGELAKAINYYQTLVNKEIAVDQQSNGFPNPNKFYVRFTPRW